MNGTANIFSVKRFAIHDGPGIRTTVFFKGCPLACKWCHNPEGLRVEGQMAYFAHNCVSCGMCETVCPTGAMQHSGDKHAFDRSKCVLCSACTTVCPHEAPQVFGQTVTVHELLPELLEDAAFFENSGGGVTLSGGECLLWAEFCAELLQQLKARNIHTAVDTCGYVPRQNIEKVLPFTDLFLYDIKAIDSEVHRRATGKPNALILENLQYIDRMGKPIEIRIPFVPGYNDSQMHKIYDFLQSLPNVTTVKVLPYHNLAGSKYEALGMINTLPSVLPTEEQLLSIRKIFETA